MPNLRGASPVGRGRGDRRARQRCRTPGRVGEGARRSDRRERGDNESRRAGRIAANTGKAGGGVLGQFGAVWAGSGRSGLVQGGLGRFRAVWAGLGRSGLFWAGLDRSGPVRAVWTGSGPAGRPWRSGPVGIGPVWTGLGRSWPGAIRTGLAGLVWGGLVWSGSVAAGSVRLGPVQGRSGGSRATRTGWLSEGGEGKRFPLSRLSGNRSFLP